MENTINNYKEENENLRLRIELSKQRENELRMEKEVILLRKQNENLTNNIKPKSKVIKKQKSLVLLSTHAKKSKVKINFKPKVIKSKPIEIKEPLTKVKDNQPDEVDIDNQPNEEVEVVKEAYGHKFIEKKLPMKKINTKYEKKLLEADKPFTVDDINEMLEKKMHDKELIKEAKKASKNYKGLKIKKNKDGIPYVNPEDEVNEFSNMNKEYDFHIPKQYDIDENNARYWYSVQNHLITAERKTELMNFLPKGSVILEEYENQRYLCVIILLNSILNNMK